MLTYFVCQLNVLPFHGLRATERKEKKLEPQGLLTLKRWGEEDDNVLYSEILNYTKFFSDSIYALAITLKLFISNILKMA